MAVLQINGIKKGFGSTDVLKGVSFSLEKGQVLTILFNKLEKKLDYFRG